MYTKNFKEIPVSFSKSKKAKRIIIRLKPFQGVKVSVPFYLSYSHAEKFVQSKLLWIEKTLVKIKEAEKEKIYFKLNDVFLAKNLRVEILNYSGEFILEKNQEKDVQILIPERFSIYNQEIQTEIKTKIIDLLKEKALDYLPSRLADLAKTHQLNFKKISIRNNSSRWGSCSFNNNISLNLHLMRLPDNLIDYVLLHELAHTRVKNHSKEFWDFLSLICPDAKSLDKKLRSYNLNW